MSKISPLHFINASLVFGLVLAVTDAVAQSQLPTTGGTASDRKLVYTACEQGVVTACGNAPVSQHCNYKFDLILNPKDRAFGFNFGGWVCTDTGSKTLYKDFYEGAATGVCVAYPTFPSDATARTARYDENGEEIEAPIETC